MPLVTYAKYLTNLEGMLDDSPLAIYDAEFGDEDSPTSDLADEYTVPACFSPDLFELADASIDNTDASDENDDSEDDSENDSKDSEEQPEPKQRPPWRWILIGPERSGTGLHIDPLYTNAWVTILQGKKRWILFPPETPKDKIGLLQQQSSFPNNNDDTDTNTLTKEIETSHQLASVVWFRDYYDIVTSDNWPVQWKPVEVLQTPGETVFVPNGWPHLVLNLELTVAVTHNYASEWGGSLDSSLERMWREVVEEEPEFGRRWYDGMVRRRRLDLVERVLEFHDEAKGRGELWALNFSFGNDCL